MNGVDLCRSDRVFVLMYPFLNEGVLSHPPVPNEQQNPAPVGLYSLQGKVVWQYLQATSSGSENQPVLTFIDLRVRCECMSFFLDGTLLVPCSRWGPSSLRSGGSRRSINHMSRRRLNSLYTPVPSRSAGISSRHNPGKPRLCRRTRRLTGTVSHGRSILDSPHNTHGSPGLA
jgi:hypothetical protein